MARPPDGLTLREAGLLLRCQEVRDARLRAEQTRQHAATAQAQADVVAAEQTADAHRDESATAIAQAYATVIGQAVEPMRLLDLRGLEQGITLRRAELDQNIEAARNSLDEASRLLQALLERRVASSHRVLRRERLVSVLNKSADQRSRVREDRRTDDMHLATRRRRPYGG